MPRKGTLEFENETWSASSGDIDLFEFSGVADTAIAITGLTLDTLSETGESGEEWLRIQVIRGHTVQGSAGNTHSPPRPVSPNDTLKLAAYSYLNGVVASGGSPVNLHSDAFEVRVGYDIRLTPGNWWWAPASGGQVIVVRAQAPADDVTVSGTLYFVEMP